MKIKIEENDVIIYDENNNEAIYSIDKNELNDDIDLGGFNVSFWIHELIQLTWMEHDILYELAVLIQKEFPHNNIDWYETFFMVEKKYYLEHVQQMKNLVVGRDLSQTGFNSVIEAVNMGIKENNDFVNGEISKTVNRYLNQYGLN